MKLTLEKENIALPLQTVIGVVGRRQTMPILSNVLLSISSSQLSVIATDLEVELQSSCQLNHPPTKTGNTTVSGRKLMDICRSLPEGSILDLESTDKNLRIHSEHSNFTLATLPVDEFPTVQEQPEKTSFAIPEQTLLSIVKRTHFAIAENNPHYYLNGLLLEIKDGMIHAVASDAHRMSLYSMAGQSTENILSRIIIPKKAITELSRLLNDTSDLATINITRNYIRIHCNHFILTSKLIDSKYPNYVKQIHSDTQKRVVLNRDIFKDALVRVGILSNEILRSMRLELSPGLLRMTAYNSEQEQAEETIPIDYNGESLDIGFNIAYLLDVLATIKTAEIAISVKDSKSGVLIEEVSGQEDCLYIVMPFQL